MDLKDEFIHGENSPHEFPYKVGHHVATSLSGFIAGVIFASIVWMLGIYLFKIYMGIG